MNFYLQIFEFGALLTFLWILFTQRKNRMAFEVIILAFLYGLMLEALNIRMSGAYLYSQDFLFDFGNIPLAIGAGWAIVYYVSSKMAGNFSLIWWQSPFLTALIALSYDFILDTIAIRLDFWRWAIPLNQEWYGVPYENFFGWLVVVWIFSLIINLSFEKSFDGKKGRALRFSSIVVAPVLASVAIISFLNFSAIFSSTFSFRQVLSLFSSGNYFYFYDSSVQTIKGQLLMLVIFIFAVLSVFWLRKSYPWHLHSRSRNIFLISSTIHLLFLFLLFSSGIFIQYPIFIIFAFMIFLLDFSLELFPQYLLKRSIFSKDLSVSAAPETDFDKI